MQPAPPAAPAPDELEDAVYEMDKDQKVDDNKLTMAPMGEWSSSGFDADFGHFNLRSEPDDNQIVDVVAMPEQIVESAPVVVDQTANCGCRDGTAHNAQSSMLNDAQGVASLLRSRLMPMQHFQSD